MLSGRYTIPSKRTTQTPKKMLILGTGEINSLLFRQKANKIDTSIIHVTRAAKHYATPVNISIYRY